MGRDRTGAETTAGVKRIELSYLLRAGYLRKWEIAPITLSWSDNWGNSGGSIGIEPHYTDEDAYIKLKYTITHRDTGEKQEFDYNIDLEERPSNLGRGSVLYFVCPETYKLCRILYQAYGSNIFKSRGAYNNRIYYPLQVSSKLGIYNDKYWELEKKLNKLQEGRASYQYKGRPTKKRIRINRLIDKQTEADRDRWIKGMGVRLSKSIARAGGY